MSRPERLLTSVHLGKPLHLLGLTSEVSVVRAPMSLKMGYHYGPSVALPATNGAVPTASGAPPKQTRRFPSMHGAPPPDSIQGAVSSTNSCAQRHPEGNLWAN